MKPFLVALCIFAGLAVVTVIVLWAVGVFASAPAAVIPTDPNNDPTVQTDLSIHGAPTYELKQSALVGTGASGAAKQGFRVSASSNGEVVAWGGPEDDSSLGGVWVAEYNTSTQNWQQLDDKLTGSVVIVDVSLSPPPTAELGTSVSMSSNGGTIAAGAPSHSTSGGVSIFEKNTSTGDYEEQTVLLGAGASAGAEVGRSVVLSADGNICAYGGNKDDSNAGAVWVQKRTGTSWSAFGGKLTGTGLSAGLLGTSIDLSSDGQYLASGAPLDASGHGAVLIFKLNEAGTAYEQQGDKLVGTGVTGATGLQGSDVALNASGTKVAWTAPGHEEGEGGFFVATRSGETWTVQNKLYTVTGSVGLSGVTLISQSAVGDTIVVGGTIQDSSQGASYVFYQGENDTEYKQIGSKLVDTDGATGAAQQGMCELSKDRKVLLVGAPANDTEQGAVFIYRDTSRFVA